MHPHPSLQLAPQGAILVGYVQTQADAAGNATLSLPAGTSVGDLVLVQALGFNLTFGGTSTGSWTTAIAAKLFYKKLLDLGSITVAGFTDSVPLVVMVFRGPSQVGNVNVGVTGSTSSTYKWTGLVKSNACQAIVAVVGSNSTNDGASAYVMTSPVGGVALPRQAQSSPNHATIGALYNLLPTNFTSGADIVATGTVDGTSYNVSFAAELT